MDILIADATAFGAFPTQKENRLNNIYLITKSTDTPDDAEKAIFITCINANMAVQSSVTDTARKYLKANATSVWLVNCMASKGSKVVWVEFDENVNNDYYTQEQAKLKADFKDLFPWACVTKNGECLANIIGVAPFSIRNIKSRPASTKGTKKPACRYNSAAISYLRNVLNEYKDCKFTISSPESPVEPLEQAYAKIGGDHTDTAGFHFEKIRVPEGSKSHITSKGHYLVRHNANRRNQTVEPARAGHIGVNIKDPLLRAKVNAGWMYFTHKAIPNSYGLAQILAKAYPKTLGKEYDRLYKTSGEKPVVKDLFGERLDIIANPNAIKAIRDLEIEGLSVQGDWKPFDLSAHNEELIGQFIEGFETKPDISRADVYTFTDYLVSKQSHAKKKYGLESFRYYLLHPMHRLHSSFRAECGHYYWMMWCENQDVNFIEVESLT
ncbi:hypothetical protein ABXZ88_003299 [Vibrio fluvialis]|uniref:hypothetical protein n=1 Tax=Vibrio fluvialis TaxID=676 RepID=UPI0023A9AA07|nr:hypothetical protein [Vibrio fluvialis]MDE5179078.1 hypothetical protein [Vibrio fluvialis]